MDIDPDAAGLRRNLLLVLVLAMLVFPTAGIGADDDSLTLSSGPARVTVLELYTSEGCSSCPPADRWLSGLADHPGLWQEFVPIAFHVDYWDYIGWRDRFAHAEYGERQRRYAEEGGARFVYTPGVFVNGQEWHGWRTNREHVAPGDDVGLLHVAVDGERVTVRFDGNRDSVAPAVAHVALLGMNLETRVRAGENGGRKLQHDFVALGLSSALLETAGDGQSAELSLPEPVVGATRHALVVWVSGDEAQVPLQAVGAFLPGR